MNQNKWIKIGRVLTLLGYFTLIIGLFIWHLIINPLEKQFISIIIFVQIGPLILPLKGLLNGKVYTHAWAMYLAIFYFVIGVWYAGDSSGLTIGLFIITTSLLFFAGCLLYVRYKGKALNT